MGNSRTRRQGNIIFVKIPEVFAVSGRKIYYLHRNAYGAILLVPRIRDYFADTKDGEYVQQLEWEDIYVPLEREKIE